MLRVFADIKAFYDATIGDDNPTEVTYSLKKISDVANNTKLIDLIENHKQEIENCLKHNINAQECLVEDLCKVYKDLTDAAFGRKNSNVAIVENDTYRDAPRTVQNVESL